MCKHNSQLQLNMNSYLIYLMSLSGHLQTPKILCNVMFSEGYQKKLIYTKLRWHDSIKVKTCLDCTAFVI